MSLVFIEGLGKRDFNDFEYLTFTDGWNGGQWSNWEVVTNPEKYHIIHASEDKITLLSCINKTIHGTDLDMWHKYPWKSTRLYACFNTVLGTCEVPLYDKKSIMFSLIDKT